MTRQNVLLRLGEILRARSADLCKTLEDEVKNLRDFRAADATGDSADAAFNGDSNEVSSQLAQLDSRQLSQIDRAFARLKQGKYGTCESCEGKIALTRLNALPYATLCVSCEREREMFSAWQGGSAKGNWNHVIDSYAPGGDHWIRLSEMEMGAASKR